jgi:FkbM family methyltransferase
MNQWLSTTVEAYISKYGRTENPVVYEVGSRDAKDAAELASRIGTEKPRLVVFEPNPASAQAIRETHPEAELHEVAISDFTGTAPFITFIGNAGNIGSSSLRLDWKKGELKGTVIEVPVERLDNIIGKEIIDIMKIDCEGKSLEVLRGMGDKIRLVRVYHVETEQREPERQAEIGRLLTEAGYELIAVENEYLLLDDQIWRKK